MTAKALTPKKFVGIVSFMNAAGAQEALLRLGRQMRERGHAMEVWFIYEEDTIHRNEPGIRVFVHKTKLSPLEYLKSYLQLVRALRRERPDAVVGFLPLGNVFGMSAAWLARVPWRIASQRAPGPTFGKVMRLLDRWLGTLGIYSKIVCVSGAVSDSFADYPRTYRSKLSVIHNGIEWQPAPGSKTEARAGLGLPADVVLVGAIGRMKTQKNYPFLLKILAATPGVILAVAGDGALRPELENLAADLGITSRIRFLGALTRDEVRLLLRASDIFIQPSLYEGQSNAVLEAMHEGMPILVSDIPEQRETVVDETSREAAALLAPLGDLDAWTSALARLRDDAGLRQSLGASAQAMVARRFGLQRMADRFEAVLAAGKAS